MDRRSLLAGVTVATLLAGCSRRDDPSDDHSTRTTAPGDHLAYETHSLVQTSGTGRPVFDGGLAYADEGGREPYAALVTGEAGTDRFDWAYVAETEAADWEGETRAFVGETDFDEAVLLVYQCRLPGTGDRLAVETVRLTEDGLHVVVDVDRQSGGAAEILETLLVRVELDGGTTPAAVELHDHPWFEDGVTTRTDE